MTMRTSFRLAIAASVVLLIYLVQLHLSTLDAHFKTLQLSFPWHKNGDANGSEEVETVGDEVTASNASIAETPSGNAPSSAATSETSTNDEEDSIPEGKDDKIIVMARLKTQDTNWVGKELSDWQNAIYTVDDPAAPLHTSQNKGREANAYLTYLIEHYDRLPSTIAFLHAHRDGYPGGWHTDAPNYDNVIAMRQLRLDFVQSNGYANLRCIHVPGCPDEIQPFRNPSGDKGPIEHAIQKMWPSWFNNTQVPEVLATPCCAQFAVSREQVLKRPREDYENFRTWLYETDLEDSLSGRVFEYLWHVIFGQTAVYCPATEQCWREVYGRGR